MFTRLVTSFGRMPSSLAYTSVFTLTNRTIATFPALCAKKPSRTKARAPAAETDLIDFDALNAKYQDTLARFARAATDAKLGKTSPQIFDRLLVLVNGDTVPFTSVAQTSLKGRNFIITLFEPRHAHSVINAILGSGLNMNCQIDPSNQYTLKSPLPTITAETKRDAAKKLKQEYEALRNGASRHSLAAVRNDARTKLKKNPGTRDADLVESTMARLEETHKLYATKLQDLFKQAETAILR